MHGMLTPLAELLVKKSNFSNNLPKGGQGSVDEPLSREIDPLCEPNQPDLYRDPSREVVMDRGPDDTFEEVNA